MDERTTGLILRTRPLTETSLIVHWLTQDYGRLATVAKGARRPNSPFRGKLDLLFEADFSFRRSRRSELHALREVVLRNPNPALRSEFRYLQQAAYCIRLLEQTTETDTPLPAFFQLLHDFLTHLPLAPPRSWFVFVFELKLLAELGLSPPLQDAALTPGTRSILGQVIAGSWAGCHQLQPSLLQLSEIRTYLRDFLLLQLGQLPQGRDSATP